MDLAPLALPSITAVIAGTDEGAIIEVLTQRSNAQRQQILKAYKAHYGRVLLDSPSTLLLPCAPILPRPTLRSALAEISPALASLPQGRPSCESSSCSGCTTSTRGGCPFPFASLPLRVLQSQDVPRATPKWDLNPPHGYYQMSPTSTLPSPVSSPVLSLLPHPCGRSWG